MGTSLRDGIGHADSASCREKTIHLAGSWSAVRRTAADGRVAGAEKLAANAGSRGSGSGRAPSSSASRAGAYAAGTTDLHLASATAWAVANTTCVPA
jgi:hypothetical protein